MEHIDFQGLATLVVALGAAAASIITAVRQQQTHEMLQRVEKQSNGIAGQLVQEAARAAASQAAQETASAIMRRGIDLGSNPGPE